MTNITTVGFTECKNCDYEPNKNGHDACIGFLEGVRNACCGHGINEPYVQFDHDDYHNNPNANKIKGKKAIEYIKKNSKVYGKAKN